MLRATQLVFIVSALLTARADAEEAMVAVAANFSGAMNGLVSAFEDQTAHSIQTVFGSSGRFYAQIKNGAPFHAFLSADQEKPQALIDEQLASANSRFTYAIGSLVLWSADSDLIDADGAVLREGNFVRLAIANPMLAPYGAAALEVLENLNLQEIVRGKIIRGANIAQVYQYVSTGNTEIGMVALSQVVENGKIARGSGWIVPANLHTPIRQDAVLLSQAENNVAAREFLQFLHSTQGKQIIESFGYQTLAN
ncbi:MAG: molybdate ABC transporter substrate-binding protein [Proteobacteria bacterium]|nr:molybdate ABC transporter substrate-binding protein [Pseudomonadota bacterium]